MAFNFGLTAEICAVKVAPGIHYFTSCKSLLKEFNFLPITIHLFYLVISFSATINFLVFNQESTQSRLLVTCKI